MSREGRVEMIDCEHLDLSLVRRYHLCPYGAWLHVAGGHHGLVQPVCAGVEVIQ